MQFDDIWIAGTGAALGERVPIERAVADGSYPADAAASTGMVSYADARHAPPELAVAAGRQAIKEAANAGTVVGADALHLHSHGYFQGIDMWPAACWIAGRLLGAQLTGMPLTVSAASNGSLASLELAAGLLTARPDLPAALLTLADRFAPPVDRFHLSPGMVFGDGGAAAVVSRTGGPLRLVSVVSEADTDLEGLSRGDEPFGTVPYQHTDTRKRTREFLAKGELSLRDVRQRSATRTRSVVDRALAEAGLSIEQVDWYCPPFVGKALMADSFLRPLPGQPRNLLTDLGLTTGHLGPADGVYALHHLVTTNLLRPGATVLLVGTGMGFTFSAAVLAADGG
ncbi:ketoacyl-ACP synthase III family protein [Krasilnikovia sp. MM14-A1259]|uniref:ketoacyl-ACP synthase III family protein n=1 Tax=Krasilnikovia sp. MM14-A1259 TaxID=3373539 RepID=UPI00381B265D